MNTFDRLTCYFLVINRVIFKTTQTEITDKYFLKCTIVLDYIIDSGKREKNTHEQEVYLQVFFYFGCGDKKKFVWEREEKKKRMYNISDR